jgi:hypothetical protein
VSQYIPIPPNKEDPAVYAFGELQDLARSLVEAKESVPFQILNAAPAKPREGMIAHADGTNWNPGSGAGPYSYIGGTWIPLFTGGGGGSGANLTWTAATRTIASDTGSDAVITIFTDTNAGLAPASGGGTTNFLRADATWAAPPGGSGGTGTSYFPGGWG